MCVLLPQLRPLLLHLLLPVLLILWVEVLPTSPATLCCGPILNIEYWRCTAGRALLVVLATQGGVCGANSFFFVCVLCAHRVDEPWYPVRGAGGHAAACEGELGGCGGGGGVLWGGSGASGRQ